MVFGRLAAKAGVEQVARSSTDAEKIGVVIRWRREAHDAQLQRDPSCR